MTLAPIGIGIGGWTCEPWLGGVSYPDKWLRERELEGAARHVAAIAVDGTVSMAVSSL